ncbi:hypothetical protein POM88_014352 [Heracleum sosnowskyi]|uniref:Plant/T31B5-30 protein n=1 Tax=Heracleum sosnowskyi TaxID=360622 RepID=A0AAD8N460_9APIA|nr:hypothetical protein POM88_014352 [Heracleum sosnowskyi]
MSASNTKKAAMDFKGALLKGLKVIPSSSTMGSIKPPISTKKPNTLKKLRKRSKHARSKRLGVWSGLPVYYRHPLMGLAPTIFWPDTEEESASSGDPCVDFFFRAVPFSSQTILVNCLESSWAHDPLITLKLICNIRSIRGTGKNDREGFYMAALWLHRHHPKTLAYNVEGFASFGNLKDLVEILFRLVQGPDAREKLKQEWSASKCSRGRLFLRGIFYNSRRKERTECKYVLRYIRKKRSMVRREVKIQENKAKGMEDKQRARNLRKQKQLERSRKALDMYNTDLNYQFLHEQVSTLFADMLKADMKCLNSGDLDNISSAGKWCPTIDSSYDKYTLICASIAKKVFPRESYPEYDGIEDAHYVYRVRDRLRKQVLVPLHRALKLPEVYMSAKEWSSIPYDRVSSVAMKKYTKIFRNHDRKRFNEYLENEKQGKAKVAVNALLPHNLIKTCLCGNSEEEKTAAELQWKEMVDDMLRNGKLTNCIAVSNVSEYMDDIPMEVSVALGLLVSELSVEPWKGHVINFSQHPQLHLIEGNSLLEKSQLIREMDCDYWAADFLRVFDEILKVAVAAKLSEDQMIKTVFVFSDWDRYSASVWETDYMVIQKKFKENGYERVPNIVFWNLGYPSKTPVTATQNGVAKLSGYSKKLLTLFMKGGGEIYPELVFEAVISGDEYQELDVYD